MRHEGELVARAKAIVDANRYMTLATADEAGLPWASPVWYATENYRDFFWVSVPEARHSRNIAARRQIAIVIFDSQVPVGSAQALYIRADADAVPHAELDEGVALFSRYSHRQGLREWTRAEVQAPAPLRLYRAGALERSILAPGDERVIVPL